MKDIGIATRREQRRLERVGGAADRECGVLIPAR